MDKDITESENILEELGEVENKLDTDERELEWFETREPNRKQEIKELCQSIKQGAEHRNELLKRLRTLDGVALSTTASRKKERLTTKTEKQIIDGLVEISERLADFDEYENVYEPILQAILDQHQKPKRKLYYPGIIIYYDQVHLSCKPAHVEWGGVEVDTHCPYILFQGAADDAEQFGQNMVEYGEWTSYLIPQFCNEPVIWKQQ